MTIAALMLILLVAPAGSPIDADRPAASASGPILLDFHAEWCGPCKQMRPAVAKLVQMRYPVKSIDIDRSPELASKYKVTGVPCFIVVDERGKVLDRTEGYQPAANLAKLFNDSTKNLPEPTAEEEIEKPARRTREVALEEGGKGETTLTNFRNPKPWETVVRIKVHDGGLMGFGSGTIISSTNDEAIILSCAHIFKIRGPIPSDPKKFPRPVSVDLFDGKITGTRPAQVHFANETYKAEVIDYDFGKDVSLIRIRPNRKLPASRVVPPGWTPKAGLAMIAVGCPEGQDATAWDTEILTPKLGLDNGAGYEGMGCRFAPKQGRSGGGLYTPDGFVAGVCDFAEPKGDVGLYATPTSIHRILDKNRLMTLYEKPVDQNRRALLADGRSQGGRSSDKTKPELIARAQSPDEREGAEVTLPPPEMLGIRTPDSEGATTTRVSRPRPKQAWQAENQRALATELRRPPVESADEPLMDEDEEQPTLPTLRTPKKPSKWQVEKAFD